MLMLVVGFASLSFLLGFSFYRKYQTRLGIDSLSKRYSRIADYCGRPIHLQFDYRQEGSERWESVDANVEEIYHYGDDYFLKGHAAAGKRGLIYKRSRITNLRIDARGQELRSLEGLFAEAEGAGSRAAA